MTACIFMGNVICCVTEEPERLDKRKLRREKRQGARGRFGHMERYQKLGRKAIRKIKAIEKSMARDIDAHFGEQLKNGTNNVWIPGGRK